MVRSLAKPAQDRLLQCLAKSFSPFYRGQLCRHSLEVGPPLKGLKLFTRALLWSGIGGPYWRPHLAGTQQYILPSL